MVYKESEVLWSPADVVSLLPMGVWIVAAETRHKMSLPQEHSGADLPVEYKTWRANSRMQCCKFTVTAGKNALHG